MSHDSSLQLIMARRQLKEKCHQMDNQPLDFSSKGWTPSGHKQLSLLLGIDSIPAISRYLTMLLTTLLAFTALVEALPEHSLYDKRQGGTTMLRFGCPQLVIDRIDPLVNPGQAPSPHVHQIVGGNGFNVSMTTGDVSKTASCTTCSFSDDFSNYWTANLYFKARNGTYKRVPQGGAAYVWWGFHFTFGGFQGMMAWWSWGVPRLSSAFTSSTILHPSFKV